MGGIAAQLAVNEHVPAPALIVTVAVAGEIPLTAPTVQTPAVPVMVGATAPRALVVAVTVKVDWYTAFAGAPVNVTFGVAMLTVSRPAAYVRVYEAVPVGGA